MTNRETSREDSAARINLLLGCRLCGSKKLQRVLCLENMPLTDQFIRASEIGKEFISEIDVRICLRCGTTQTSKNIDLRSYYSDYRYTSGYSRLTNTFMELLAARISRLYFRNARSPSVIEVGSGSGEQLLSFSRRGFRILGIEPSRYLSDLANNSGAKTLTSLFDENTVRILPKEMREVDLVISSYTFDHITDPNGILSVSRKLLKEDGLFVVEVHDLDRIIERNEFCLFEHEHTTYFNRRTIARLLAKHGFEVLTFDLLSDQERRANSLLAVARKSRGPSEAPIRLKNEVARIANIEPSIRNSIMRFDEWLERHQSESIAAYGAGGRGVMTIAALENARIFRYIVDKNPKGVGLLTPKSHIPLFGIEELAVRRVDKIVVFSYGYMDEILEEVCSRFDYKRTQFVSIMDIMNRHSRGQNMKNLPSAVV